VGEIFKYYAFITYETGGDKKWAKWLKRKLENYRIPVETIVKLRNDESADKHPVPENLSVTHNEGSDYPLLCDTARYLIVVCSPGAARSDKVREHIKFFIDEGREKYIVPFIVDGVPVGDEARVCYPPGLPTDILGVTLSDGTKKEALIKIVSRLLGVKYSGLYQRHLVEQRRFIIRAVAVAAALLVLTTALAVWAVSAEISSARRREESDGLVRFLIEEISGDENTPAGIRLMIEERAAEYYKRRGER